MHSINWHSFFFLLFALLSCGFALSVVLTSNVVRMAFYLVLSLGAAAGLFFLAGADFVGAMQLLIYVGGTLVLLVFGVMLTAQSPFVSMKTSSNEWIAALIVGGSLLAVLIRPALTIREWQSEAITQARENVSPDGIADNDPTAEPTSAPIGMALAGARVDRLDVPPERRVGLSGYMLPFEIVSVHLLVVLIGAAYLARTKRRTLRRGAVDLENL